MVGDMQPGTYIPMTCVNKSVRAFHVIQASDETINAAYNDFDRHGKISSLRCMAKRPLLETTLETVYVCRYAAA